jgi:hypothetical protein
MFTEATIHSIVTNITTAKKLGIEEIIFENNLIRAMTPSRSAVVLHSQTEDFPSDNFAISRLPQFLSKLSLLEEGSTRKIKLAENSLGNITAIKMSAGKIRAEHRLPRINSVTAPKIVRFGDSTSFTLTPDHASLILKAIKSISQLKENEKAGFKINQTGLSLVLGSHTGDSLAAELTHLIAPDSLETTITFYYPIKELSIILKEVTSDQHFEICLNNGLLKTTINRLTVYLLSLK